MRGNSPLTLYSSASLLLASNNAAIPAVPRSSSSRACPSLSQYRPGGHADSTGGCRGWRTLASIECHSFQSIRLVGHSSSSSSSSSSLLKTLWTLLRKEVPELDLSGQARLDEAAAAICKGSQPKLLHKAKSRNIWPSRSSEQCMTRTPS